MRYRHRAESPISSLASRQRLANLDTEHIYRHYSFLRRSTTAQAVSSTILVVEYRERTARPRSYSIDGSEGPNVSPSAELFSVDSRAMTTIGQPGMANESQGAAYCQHCVRSTMALVKNRTKFDVSEIGSCDGIAEKGLPTEPNIGQERRPRGISFLLLDPLRAIFLSSPRAPLYISGRATYTQQTCDFAIGPPSVAPSRGRVLLSGWKIPPRAVVSSCGRYEFTRQVCSALRMFH